MNIYARYFNQETLAHNMDELLAFLSDILDIEITQDLIDDISKYAGSDIAYPKRYKIRPRVYFILIKTTAETIEEFKNNKNNNSTGPTPGETNSPSPKDIRISELSEEREGWYKGSLTFKRVIQIPSTGKFQYEDTTFSALTKAHSGQDCYNSIINHLKSRQDIDTRSQFPSAKGNNFKFTFVAPFSDEKVNDEPNEEELQEIAAEE